MPTKKTETPSEKNGRLADKAFRAKQAETAVMNSVEADRRALAKRTAELRALRLAKEAADLEANPPAAKPARKKPARKLAQKSAGN